MSLDISTPKGQKSLAQENALIRSFENANAGYHIIQTPKDKAADVDGFICKRERIAAVFESKCRECDMAQMSEWGWEWLVTFDKLTRGAEIAKSLQVPFYGLLYLVNEPIGISIRITDPDGNFIPKIRVERTLTQRTINGGEIVRTNAYISLQPQHTRFPII